MTPLKKITSHPSFPLLLLCLGLFVVIMDVTVVNVALPNIAKGLSGTVSQLQWVVDAYTLTFCCFLLFAGSLGDAIGNKSLFYWGLFLFSGASLGCGFSLTMHQLIFFRFFQGIFASFILPSSLSMIHALYKDSKSRARAIGIWGGAGGIAAAAGPIVGSIVTYLSSWRFVFFINVPLGLVGSIWVFLYILDAQKKKSVFKFDFLGQLLGIIAIAAIAFSLIDYGKQHAFSIQSISAFFIFLLALFLFIMVEKKSAHPMLPLEFFKVRLFSNAVLIGMALNFSFYGELFILPLYFEDIRNYSVLYSGLAIFPLLAIVTLASYYGGKLTGKLGFAIPMMTGFLVGAVGFLGMLVAEKTYPPYVVLIFPLLLIGFGIAFTMPAATLAVMTAVPTKNTTLASAVLNTSRQLGSLMGVAVFGSMVANKTHFMIGMHATLIFSSIVFLCGFFLAFSLRNVKLES